MKIKHLMSDFKDFKSCLWIPLTFKQKFELYLKSIRKRERELISLLFIFDARLKNQRCGLLFNKETNNILKFDKFVEGTLTTLIYEKYIQAWENQTTKAKIEKLVKHMKEQSTHFSDHISFIRFFHETYFKSVELINDLKLKSIVALQKIQTRKRKSSEYEFKE